MPDAANNPGLVSDCEALLAAREALVGNTGNAELNWSADTLIREWDGIEEDSLEGAPPQVCQALSQRARTGWCYTQWTVRIDGPEGVVPPR